MCVLPAVRYTLAWYCLSSRVRLCVRLSVCLSVTSWNCTKTATRWITQKRCTLAQGLCSFVMQKIISLRNSDGITSRGREIEVGWVKIVFYDWCRSLRLRRLTAENLCPSATAVLRVHEICPFPLLWLLAFTTACTTVQVVIVLLLSE